MDSIGPTIDAAVFDHIIIVVRDLERGAEALHKEFGLVATGGGIHPRIGTGNRIVPVQGGYLELMGIVNAERARESWLGQKVMASIDAGCALFDWMKRAESIEGIRNEFTAAGWDLPPATPGFREVAGGGTLEWVTQKMIGLPQYRPGMPFFIEWRELDAGHPSAQSPTPDVPRLTTLAIGAASARDGEAIRQVAGGAPVDIRVGGEPGLAEVCLDLQGKRITIPRSWGME